MKQQPTKGISINKVNFDRIEGDKAVLIIESDELIIPSKLIPKGVKDGDILTLTISTDEVETSRREKKAKEILNEIFNI